MSFLKLFLYFAAFLCLPFAPLSVQADNLLGMDVAYKCLGDNRYEITVNVYRDCGGAPINGAQIIANGFEFTSTAANCIPPQPEGAWQVVSGSGQQLAFYCATEATNCTNPTSANAGAQKYTFTRVYKFSGLNCTEYTLKLAAFARTLSLTNATVTAANPLAIYQESSKINLSLAACNNSPVITRNDVVRVCQSQTFTYNPGAIDPDGDKLQYRLGACLGGTAANPSAPLPYNAGFNGNNPLTSIPAITLDANTGDLTLFSTSTETAAVCIYIDEIRNGQVINTTVQDLTIITTPCGGNALPRLSGFDNNPVFTKTICTGGTATYTLYATDLDPGQNLTVDWNGGLPGATFTPQPQVTLPSGQVQVPIVITWTPTAARTEPYTFVVRVRDDACPTRGSNFKAYSVKVNFSSLSVGDFVTTNCTEAHFNADVQFGVPPYSFLWQGTGGLTANPNNTSADFFHTYPAGAGSYTYELTVTDGSGCFNSQFGTVNITKPDVDASFSVSSNTVCVTDTAVFTYFGVEVNPSIQWNFGTFANPPTATGTTPVKVKYNLPGTKTITFTIDNGGCKKTVTKTIEITPEPLVGAGPDLYLCKGVGQMIQGTANIPLAGCAVRWEPSEYLSNPNSLTPIANPPTDMTYILRLECGGRCLSNFDTVRVFVRPRPNVFITQDEFNYCQGQTAVQLNATGNGGVGNLNFKWQPTTGLSNAFIPNPTAFPNTTTVYTVTTTDENGCESAPQLVLVNSNPVPQANAGPDVFLCPGDAGKMLMGSGNFGGFGSFDYEWFPKTGLSNGGKIRYPIARPDTTTIYYLVVTDQETGCKSVVNTLDALQTVTVYVAVPPVIDAGEDVSICQGSSVVIGQIPANGGPVYAYEWLPNSGLSPNNTVARPTAQPSSTTTYYVWVTSNGCRSLGDSIVVTVKPLPTVNIDGPIETCPGEPVQIVTQTSGAEGPFTYRWEPNDGTLSDATHPQPIASPKNTTTYSLYVGAQGCPEQFIEAVLVQTRPVPSINLDPDGNPNNNVLCSGETLTLPAVIQSDKPFQVSWSPGASLDDSTKINPVANPTESVTYTVSVTQGLCTVTDTFRVLVRPFIPAHIDVDTTIICLGDRLTLTGMGGIGSAGYAWSGQIEGSQFSTQTTITIEPADTGTFWYSFGAVEANCFGSDTVFIKVLLTPTPKFTYTYPSGCVGLTVSFVDESENADDVIWDFGDGSALENDPNPSHTYTAAGEYTVTLYTSRGKGCGDRRKAQKTVSVSAPIVADFTSVPAETDTVILGNSVVKFTDASPGAVSWFWNFGDEQSSTEQNPSHLFYKEGVFTVKLIVTDRNGCLYFVEKRYVVVVPEVFIPNVITPNGDGKNDRWVVNYTGVKTFEAYVFDRWGNRLFTTTDPNGAGWDGRNASGSEAPSGVYWYRVKIGEREFDGNVTLLR